MKILLLGKNGLLGSEIAKVLADHELTLWDKAELDITNEDEVTRKITHLKPKFVINCTGYTKVDEAETNEKLAFKVNAEACEYLAKACFKTRATLLHFSTDYVFDGEKMSGYNEDEPKNPLSVYGKSKATGEDLISQTMKKFFIVRTSWLYGKNGKNFVDTIFKLAQTKDEISVVQDQVGSPTYAVDLAKAIPQFLELKQYGIYHLTNSGNCSWYELAKAVFQFKKIAVTVMPITTDQFPRPAKRPKCSILNNTKLPGLREWKEGLKDYLGVEEKPAENENTELTP